ncbi:hypothetical protein L1987_27882 [Smallanthus sonchifolius]|uniref:Uncharacterized protein n=1 Tax=Smallanthus sonchifolius TaxID=185202 RepID=A0ACB9IBS8_9ASTR|nr:hypothetical protein L1987_27882 [Smallanthus sonchifolius]
MIGDILIFKFANGKHDVSEVSETAYKTCTFPNPTTVAKGPASITLTTTDSHYYVCTFKDHCQKGQKLTINVFPADNSVPTVMTPVTPGTPSILPTPTSATPYPPTSSPSLSPSTQPTIIFGDTTPPPPTSGAPPFTTMVLVNFLTIALAFLNY